MAVTYSTYDAKAKFSEILRRVRAGQHVIISYRGEEVAEIRPLRSSDDVEERIRLAVERGAVRPASATGSGFPRLAKRPGGLARFLESRD